VRCGKMSIVSVEDDAYVANDEHWSVSWLPVTADCIAHHYGNHICVAVVFVRVKIRRIQHMQHLHVIATELEKRHRPLLM